MTSFKEYLSKVFKTSANQQVCQCVFGLLCKSNPFKYNRGNFRLMTSFDEYLSKTGEASVKTTKESKGLSETTDFRCSQTSNVGRTCFTKRYTCTQDRKIKQVRLRGASKFCSWEVKREVQSN